MRSALPIAALFQYPGEHPAGNILHFQPEQMRDRRRDVNISNLVQPGPGPNSVTPSDENGAHGGIGVQISVIAGGSAGRNIGDRRAIQRPAKCITFGRGEDEIGHA